jgi:hypothetical protein
LLEHVGQRRHPSVDDELAQIASYDRVQHRQQRP